MDTSKVEWTWNFPGTEVATPGTRMPRYYFPPSSFPPFMFTCNAPEYMAVPAIALLIAYIADSLAVTYVQTQVLLHHLKLGAVNQLHTLPYVPTLQMASLLQL